MKFVKTSHLSNPKIQKEDLYASDLDFDMEQLALVLQGRVRFGTGTDGARGENIHGEFQKFTTSDPADTEDTIAHTLGSIPVGYIVLWQDKAGSLYQGPTTGTNWTSTNIYLKCDVATVQFLIFLIK